MGLPAQHHHHRAPPLQHQHRRRGRVPGVPDELASGAAFCVTSAAMTLLNKAALSSFGFGCPYALLAFQCAAALALVAAAAAAGLGALPPVTARALRLWLPVNLLFVGMVATSFLALRHVGVAMVTVLKNLTNWMVIAGDYALFGKRYGAGVWATLVLMLISALLAAATDLSYHPAGYAWQMVNNVMTAAYSLWLRAVMNAMAAGAHHSPTTSAPSAPHHHYHHAPQPPLPPARVDELGMVVYNNLLAVPLIALLAAAAGEPARLPREPALRNPAFIAAALGSALVSFLISVASMWFLSCTTATTFSLVGSLNKIPLAFLGIALFSAPTSANNAASIAVGLIAGVVFARAKAGGGGGGNWGGGGGGSISSSSSNSKRGSSGNDGGGGGEPAAAVHAQAVAMSVLERGGVGGSGDLRARPLG